MLNVKSNVEIWAGATINITVLLRSFVDLADKEVGRTELWAIK